MKIIKNNKIKMVVTIIMLSAFLSACSKIKQDILNSLHQTAEQTTNEKENWEKDINYRYERAIVDKDMELLKDCIAEGADYNDMNGLSPVFLSYIQENYLMAEYLLSLGASPNWNDKKGISTLHLLTQSYTYEECKTLLSYGADVNYIDKKGMTEIEFAASNQMAGIDILQLLIDYGAKVTPKTVEIAFEAGNRECDLIRFLVKELRKNNTKTELTPIVEYTIMGETEKVKGLVKSEYKRLSSKEKEYVLKFTGAYGSVDTLKELVKQNVYVEQIDWIISEAALKNGNLKILEYSIKNKMLALTNNERYPLTVAVAANQYDTVQYLISQGANVNEEEDPDLEKNAREAAINGNVEMLQLLFKSGYDIDIDNIIDVVSEAAKFNNIEVLQYLSEAGFLAKIRHDYDSPVDNAGIYSLEVVKYLLNQGFSSNGFSNTGLPLYTSIDNNNTEMSSFLIEHGTDVNILCDERYLMKAVRNGNLEIVKALVEHGANINEKDYGSYPLVYTAMGRTILKYLIENGADVNVQNDKDGTTALMAAAEYGNIEGVKILLGAGADKSIKNQQGQTAYDIAKDRNHVKCMELLSDSESNQ